ncbi:MAG TPA: 6-pyruvoyl-tetrahydropterin synthase-related protein [Blastocatellia bacterium]|nr:6-pyruvoyl-tetrahydropterin synthase-related protein [Blastocatellia bacterium]
MSDEAHVSDKNSHVATRRARSSRPLKVSLIGGAVVLAALSVAPFFVQMRQTASGRALNLRLFSTHDLKEHLVVMEQFDKSLRSGVVYPRWLAEVNGEYGNAWTNFYPPVCYYLSSTIHAVVGDWIVTVAVLSLVAMAGSGFAFYLLSRAFYSKTASVIAATLYVLLPYHMLDLYLRGALPELLGFVFLPLLIYFAFRLGTRGRLIDYAGLGLTYGLYVMTHLPVAYLMSYVLVIYAVVWSVRKRSRVILLRVGCGMALGLLVCAIYLLPAVLEARYAYEETSTIFPYDSSYLPALPAHDSFGSTLNDTFMLQAIALAVAVIVIRSIPHPKCESKSGAQLRLWIVLGVSATLMVTAPSFYVAKLIPRTDLVAFAWRWLAISGMFTSVLVAAAIDGLAGDAVLRSRQLAYRVAIILVVCLNVWFTAQRVIVATLTNTSAASTSGLVEASYTPKGATLPQSLPDTPRLVIDPEGGVAEVVRWDPESREALVRVNEPSRVRLKTYNFPGWVARVDDKPSPMLRDTDGIQVVEVPAGTHKVEASFVNTPPRTAGGILSALGLLAVIGLATLDRVREAGRIAGQATSRKALVVESLKALVAISVTLLIGALALFWFSSRGRSGSTKVSGSEAPAKAGGSATQGSEANLHIDGVTSILVSVDEQALNELMNALPAKDNSKVDALVESGKLLRIANDTRVRILETGAGKTKVRILQGGHSMAEGWVPERWLR